jgi:hypothetical protein
MLTLIVPTATATKMEVRQCKLCGGDPEYNYKGYVECMKCETRGPISESGPAAVDGWNKLMEQS